MAMSTTQALATMAVSQAGTSIAGGIAGYRQGEYNSAVLSRQAGMIDEKKKIQAMQDDRMIRKVMGRAVATTAGKGIEMSGSPMAMLIDTRTQLEMDKAIGQYNLDVEKMGILSEAESERRGGRVALTSGIAGGVTSIYREVGRQSLYNKKSLSQDTAVAARGSSG